MQSLFILNEAGSILVEKHYRGYVDRSICTYFYDEVQKYVSREEIPPVIATPSTVLIHTQHNDIFLLFTVAAETSPLYVIEYLHRISEILTHYMDELTEYNVRANLVTVYQVLDETMDFGIPLTTEPSILLDIVKPQSTLRKAGNYLSSSIAGKSISNINKDIPQGSLSNIRWRKVGIKHSSNEFYMDITEELQATFQKSGKIENAKIQGVVQANSILSGMPDMTLDFENPGLLLDVSFHPCVRYAKYERDRSISFVPPDGHFKLLTYRSHLSPSFKLPFNIKSDFEWKEHTCKFQMAIDNSGGTERLDGIVITIPFPKTTKIAKLDVTTGFVKYNELNKICVWNIGKIPKEKKTVFTGKIENDVGEHYPGENPTIVLNFKLTQYAASGLHVKGLQIGNITYKKIFKGVRSFTTGGDHLQYRT